MSIYKKSTKELMKEFARTLKPKQIFVRKEVREWFQKRYPKIRPSTVDMHVEVMSTNSGSRGSHLSVRPDSGHDLFFKVRRGQTRLWDAKRDPAPNYPNAKSHLPVRNVLTAKDKRELLYLARLTAKGIEKNVKLRDRIHPIRGPLKAERTDTGGWFVQCGKLSVGGLLYDLELCVDRYTASKPRYWFGISASSRLDLYALVHGLESVGEVIEKTLAEKNARRDGGVYVLKKPLPEFECTKTIAEYYDDEWYLGQYTDAGQNGSELVPNLAVKFWQLCSRSTVFAGARPARLLKASSMARKNARKWEEFEAAVQTLERRTLDQLNALYAARRVSKEKKRIAKVVQLLGRDPLVVAIAKQRANFKCQVPSCSAKSFKTGRGMPYVEVHHLVQLANGGVDHPSNVVCVCPAHHRELHFGQRSRALADLLLGG